MPGFIAALGQQAASQAVNSAIGAGMGLILQKHNDKRQIKQQQKLTDMQVDAQNRTTLFNQEQALKMWHDTNIGAQKKEIEKAGMNPGLLYGMGGGGGTTASVTQGSATGAHAPSGGREIIEATSQGLSLAMLKAQTELVQAQAENVKADTANKPLQGQNIQASTGSLTQGINNAIVQERIMKLEEQLKQINLEIDGGTKEDKIMQITHITTKLAAEATMAEAQNMIDQSTKESKIKQIIAQGIGAVLNNVLTRSQTNVSNQQAQNLQADRKNIQNKISMWAQENAIDLQMMSQGERNIKIREQLKDSQLEMQGVNEIIRGISEILDGVIPKKVIHR